MARLSFFLTIWLALALSPQSARATPSPSVAFYYGPSIPPELLTAYALVVVEPSHGFDPSVRTEGQAELVAYLSIGEVADTSRERKALHPAWTLARNDAWQSAIVDLCASGFREWLERRYEALWARGYRAFFLDTLDSYQRLPREAQPAQRRALVEIVHGLRARHPEVKLLLNRGFELLDEVARDAYAVVAESLFSQWDAAARRYAEVPEPGRGWLLDALRDVRTRHGLPVVVIDYAHPSHRAEARALAVRIAALGFVPWVADGSLTTLGVGSVEIVPRRVLLITKSRPGAAHAMHDALRLLGPVLEHQGFVLTHHDLVHGLPQVAPGSLAGIVTWLDGALGPSGYGAFLQTQIEAGTRLLVFGAPGLAVPSREAEALGFLPAPELTLAALAGTKARAPVHLQIATRDAIARFEAEPRPSPLALLPLRVTGPALTAHLTFATPDGQIAQALVSTSWGAWASSHYLEPRGLHGERAWTIDPFALVSRALGEPGPVPDLTTENGARVALFSVRAAGLSGSSRLAGRPDTRALVRSLLSRYPVPHAVDLEPAPDNAVSPADRDAARALLLSPPRGVSLRALHLPPGTTRLSAQQPSITQLGLLVGTSDAQRALPMSGDYGYIPEGIGEAFPYRACAETIARTGTPRRLTPIALDYHAASLASDGGVQAIEGLYRYVLSEQSALAIEPEAYGPRVRAFREQVIVRTLDGALRILGGAALRTVRLPSSLGEVDLARSRGVASLAESAEGRWLTFLPDGPRTLVLAPPESAPRLPHLVRANAEVHAVSSAPSTLRFSLSGALDLAFSVAGLPEGARCQLQSGARRLRAEADARGQLAFRLPGVRRATLALTCRTKEARS